MVNRLDIRKFNRNTYIIYVVDLATPERTKVGKIQYHEETDLWYAQFKPNVDIGIHALLDISYFIVARNAETILHE